MKKCDKKDCDVERCEESMFFCKSHYDKEIKKSYQGDDGCYQRHSGRIGRGDMDRGYER